MQKCLFKLQFNLILLQGCLHFISLQSFLIWHNCWHKWPHFIFLLHFSLHPPSLDKLLKSSKSEITISFPWVWQHNVNLSPIIFKDIALAYIFCQTSFIFGSIIFLFSFSPFIIHSILPIIYKPILALLNATQTRLKLFKNPILFFLLLLTKLNKIISHSSPW